MKITSLVFYSEHDMIIKHEVGEHIRKIIPSVFHPFHVVLMTEHRLAWCRQQWWNLIGMRVYRPTLFVSQQYRYLIRIPINRLMPTVKTMNPFHLPHHGVHPMRICMQPLSIDCRTAQQSQSTNKTLLLHATLVSAKIRNYFHKNNY